MKDVAILGGGPTGTATAALLADAGHSVVLYEKDAFPRFHIGESLLPCSVPLLRRLRVDLSAHVVKLGADFIDERGSGQHVRYLFADALEGTGGYAYQVDRARFDSDLLRRAVELGAERKPHRVDAVEFFTDSVAVHADDSSERARFLVDASGRSTFLARRHRSLVARHDLGIAAAFCHYRGISERTMTTLEHTGNIQIFMLDEGWAWMIPLGPEPDGESSERHNRGRVSVGVVTTKRGFASKDLLKSTIAQSPALEALLAGAQPGPTHVTGDYSYANTKPVGSRYACVGDAYGFIDPVFSSGVALGLSGASKLVELLSPALSSGCEGNASLLKPFDSFLRHAHEVFGAMVHSFYHTRLVDNLFFYSAPDPALRAGLISILAGDVHRSDNTFQEMILRSRRRRRLDA